MTVSTTTSKITYLGNGTTTVFSFPFIGVAPDDITVIYTDTNGVDTTLVASQYTLVINSPPVGGLWGIGGTVTYPITPSPVVPIQSGARLTIIRNVPDTQTVTINNQGAFYPQVVEKGLDLLELQIQQILTTSEYTLQTPLTDSAPPTSLPGASERANGYLAFDANGNPIIVSETGAGPSPPFSATTRRINVSSTSTILLTSLDSWGGVSIYQSGTPEVTVQLPDIGGPYPIFDGSLNAGTYPITVLPPTGKTILGQSSYTIQFNGASQTFFSDGYQILVG